MIEDRLSNSLLNSGYQRVDSNTPGIYLYYRAEEEELKIVSVLPVMNGYELTLEQYELILNRIKVNFANSFPYRLKLLSLIYTGNADQVKRLATESKEDSHWIIDVRTNRLIIYESQSNDFAELQRTIEQLLVEEDSLKDKTGATNRNAFYRYQLMPVSMIIIAINIVVYLFTHFTPFFGGPEAMLTKGALSWYLVSKDKEYYRLLTSIFLHVDWSHLVNNMIVLLFVGGNLERAVGKIKYLLIYFSAGLIAGISSIGYNMWKEYAKVSFDNTTISIGASGAIFGIVGAILLIVIINKGRLQEISTRQMGLFVVLSLYNGVVNSQIDQAAHVGGFIAGIILAAILYRKPKRDLGHRRTT